MDVLLIDDHPLVWNGIRRAIESLVDANPELAPLRFEAVRSVREGLALAGTPFQLVLLDYILPDCSGMEGLQAIRDAFSESRICVISGTEDHQVVRAVLENDADGFVPKSYNDAELSDALRLVIRQRVYAPPEYLLAESAGRLSAPADGLPALDELSPRQHEALALLQEGLSNKAIARRMGIAEGTVKSHLSTVFRLLGVRSRAEALCLLLKVEGT